MYREKKPKYIKLCLSSLRLCSVKDQEPKIDLNVNMDHND